MKNTQQHFETIAIRTQSARTAHREHSVPLYLTSSFVFDNAEQARALFANEIEGNIYSRFSNPNAEELVRKLCLLEGAEDGLATATGMAAVFVSIAALLSAGDHLLLSRSVFGSTYQIAQHILPRWNISCTFVDPGRPEEWEASIRPNTKMIFFETPSNPALDIIDIAWVVDLAARYDLIVNVDNCFATPYLQTPAQYGVHLITHSATKFIDGQGRVLGGCVVGKKELIEQIRFFARHTGPAISPFNAWVLSKSLETLAVRMEAHCRHALELARRLEVHPEVARVKYPFLPSHPHCKLAQKQMRHGGGMITFELKKGKQACMKFLDNLHLISLSANLGDTRTIATHPASTTHSKLTVEERTQAGVTDNMLRISVGLEHIEDVWQDIEQALNRL